MRSRLSLFAIPVLLLACEMPDPDAPQGSDPSSAFDAAASAVGSPVSRAAGDAPIDALVPDASDLDLDGIDDELEDRVAADYLPFRSISPKEECPTAGIIYRVRPHPDNPAFFHILYDVLYDNDCGLDSHPGDNEAFAITVDPSRPAPEGILAMVAIAHQDTLCDSRTECVTCGDGADACDRITTGGTTWPVVYTSRNKHGNYLFDRLIGRGRCDFNCFGADRCDLNTASYRAPMLNVGEPGYPLTRDLTEAGLITEVNGFDEPSLFHYDPWGSEPFGDAGVVSEDLDDPAFDTLAPRCN